MSDDGIHLLGAAAIRELAGRLGVAPTKVWGQNFVVDANTVRRIVRAADLAPDDVVLEVGPGLGSLTLGLLEAAAAVCAVEIDPVLAQRLPTTALERAPALAGRLDVVTADALRVRAADLPAAPTALVANLPYNVGVPVVLHEMRPAVGTPAHKTDGLAELVCSNSFRSDDDEQNAVGLLHWEMRQAGGLIISTADRHALPAGSALAIDREPRRQGHAALHDRDRR